MSFSLSGGLAITLCCSGWGCHGTSRSRIATQVAPSNVAIPAKSPNQEAALRKGWKRIEVEGAVKVDIPQNMRTTAPLGDSDAYQESYRNATVRLDIAYGDFDACKTDDESIRNGTYTESFLEINGKKAKLGID
ncbi:MAG TPA: hypothetical protein VN643_03440 [Pyrinomonadaceae bacterium]|nr:hypothetical protein [Pyrinomonadaceae bacterium]